MNHLIRFGGLAMSISSCWLMIYGVNEVWTIHDWQFYSTLITGPIMIMLGLSIMGGMLDIPEK